MTLPNALGFIGLCGILIIGCGSSSGSNGGGGGDNGNTGNKCNEACAVITSCWGDTNASCMAQCEGDLAEAAEFGDGCVAAVNALAACLGGLSCQQLDGWFEEVPTDSYPCRAQDMARRDC
jgi:hypothetical protein